LGNFGGGGGSTPHLKSVHNLFAVAFRVFFLALNILRPASSYSKLHINWIVSGYRYLVFHSGVHIVDLAPKRDLTINYSAIW